MPRRPRHPHPPDVRAHILAAALRAFATHGYEGATVRRIGAEAKVAPGLLYHYFPNKEALLVALFEQSASMVAEPFVRAAMETDPARKLSLLLRLSAQIVSDNQDFWRVSYGVRFQHAVVAGLAPLIAAQSVLLHGLFHQLLSELGRPNPDVDAHLLFAAIDGMFQHYVLAPDSYPLDSAVESLIRTYGGAPASEPP